MRYLLVVLLLMLSGCGQMALEEACKSMPEGSVQTLITVAESDMSLGYTKADEIQAVLMACQGSAPSCTICGTAVVDFVYGP